MNPKVATLLGMLDDVYGHSYESVRQALDDTDEAMAQWQAPAYQSVRPKRGWPPPGTILWQIAHMAFYKRRWAAMLRKQSSKSAKAVNRSKVVVTSLAMGRQILEATHKELRAEIAGLNDRDMDKLGGTLRGFIRHDTWHASQIAVVKRLYKFQANAKSA